MEKSDIYQTVTDAIVAALESGVKAGDFVLPWNKGDALHMPRNVASGKHYRGINVLQLWCAAEAKGYTRGIWGTYKQWQEAGAQVRKDERATSIVFWKPLAGKESTNEAGEIVTGRGGMVAKGYAVFNADQVDGWQAPAEPAPLSEGARDAQVDAYFAALGGKIVHGGGRACYVPNQDMIRMPDFASFHHGHGYYSTLAHEYTHWTGHASRLGRNLSTRFGEQAYAAEELVAELGAAFTCALAGLSPVPRLDHASYIASWIKVLKNDKKAIFSASAKAQQAVDYCQAIGSDTQAIAA